MKVGMNLLVWTAHVQEKHFPLFPKLKAIGYDGVEVSIGKGDLAEYQALGQRLDREGLESTCVCAASKELNPASPDPSIRAAASDWLKTRIDFTHALGASILAGPIHSAFATFTREAPTDQEYEFSAEVLRSVGDHAKDAGVTLAIEPLNRFECYLVNTVAQSNRLLDLVDHPNIASMFDTHHANIEEKSISRAIEEMGPRMVHFHACENDRGTPGGSHIPWDEVFTALRKVGYDGWLTIESFSRLDVEFANAINVWREFSPVDELCEQGHAFLRKMIANKG